MENYTMLDIANCIINQSKDSKYPISNLQVQSILYLIAVDTKSIIFKDKFIIWSLSPVNMDTYNYIKKISNNTNKIKVKDVLYDYNLPKDMEDKVISLTNKLLKFKPWDLNNTVQKLSRVFKKYRNTKTIVSMDMIDSEELLRNFINKGSKDE